ncbi:hypothetical protein D3C81_1108720 [compost metagenome]
MALTTVFMVIGEQLQAALFTHAQVCIERVQVVITQRTALVIGVVDAVDATAECAALGVVRARCAVRGGDGAVPVGCIDVPVPAQAALQHALGQICVVGLTGARGGNERTEAVVADIPHRLGIELAAGLVLIRRGPHVRVLMDAGDIGGKAVVLAAIHAQITATLVVIAQGDAGAATEHGGRIAGEILDGAAQIAGGGDAQ